MARIGTAGTMQQGITLLGEVFQEIDRQVGAELGTQNNGVDGAEVSTFLANRGNTLPQTSAAVSRVKAYTRRMFKKDEVSFGQIGAALKQAEKSLAKAIERGDEIDTLKPTWRSIALFANEAARVGASAQEIVADRSDGKIDLDVARKGVRLTAGVLKEIEKQIGNGDGVLTTKDVEAFIAGYQNTVPTAKDAVRRFVRYLEKRYNKQEFTTDEINGALATAMKSIHAAAQAEGGRGKLASTWKHLFAFAEESQIREKNAAQIVADFVRVEAPAAGGAGPVGPRARTLAEWEKLDLETRHDILDDYGPKYDHYLTTGDVYIDTLKGKDRAYAEKLRDAMLDAVGEVDDHYGTVGEPRVSVEIVKLPTGEIVGGRVHLFQQGFDPEEDGVEIDDDDRTHHYDSEEACAAAGFDPNQDISWGVGGIFDAKGEPLGGDDRYQGTYWDWSGW